MSVIDTGTPVGAQLDWVMTSLFAGAELTDEELREHFAESFLDAVPIDMLRSVVTRVLERGRLEVDDYEANGFHAATTCHRSSGEPCRVTMTVGSEPPHQIKGLQIWPGPAPEQVPVAIPVVVLNGTSSSGKTSIATELQQVLPGTWLHASVDTFLRMASNRDGAFERILRGYHGSIGALAAAGNRLIVDTVLQEREWLVEIADALGETPTLFVGVRCPLEVLEQRETARGDRGPGTARAQFPAVHRHGAYDVEVDTSELTAKQAAAIIAKRIVDGPVGGGLVR